MNIFIELDKYKPCENMTPEENFFTQSFRIILEYYPELTNDLVKVFIGDKLHPPFECKTQTRYKNCIIDLEIKEKDRKNKLLIEIKLESPESQNQVKRYIDLKEGYVIFISKYNTEIEGIREDDTNFQGQFLWSDVYEKIKEYFSNVNNRKENSLGEQFIKYMEAKGMKSIFEGIDIDGYNVWTKFYKHYLSYRGLLEKSRIEYFMEKYKCGPVKTASGDVGYFFYFHPKNKIQKYFYVEIYLSNKEVLGNEYDKKYPEEVYLCIGIDELNLKQSQELILDNNIFFIKDTGRWYISKTLSSLIDNENNPLKQLKKIYKFYDFALEILKKEGIDI